jgi:hypothetical protein
MLQEATERAVRETIASNLKPAVELGDRLVAQGEALQKKLGELEARASAAFAEAIETIHRERDAAIAAIRAAHRP